MKCLKILSLALALSHPSVTTWSAKMKEPVVQLTFNQKLFDAGLAMSTYLVGFDKDILNEQCQMGTVYGTGGEKITLHGNGKATVESKNGKKLGTYPLQVEKEKVLVYLDGLQGRETYEQKYKLVENHVQVLTYGTTTLNVQENNTVQYLKIKILNKEAIPYSQQRLIFKGKELENMKKLSEYNIKKEHVLDLKIHPIEALDLLFNVPPNTKNANNQPSENRKTFTSEMNMQGTSENLLCRVYNRINIPTSTKNANNQPIEYKRTFTLGMNVQGICKNLLCRLYNRRVWARLGYSQDQDPDDDDSCVVSQYGIKWFDFGVLCQKLNCAACHEKLDETETIRFFACKYRVKSSLRDDKENKLFHIPNLPNSIANKKEYWKEDAWKKAYAYAFDEELEYKLKGEDKLCTYSFLCIAVEQMHQNDFVQNYDLT